MAYSSAGERDTRDTLRYFERVRDFFLQINQREPPKPVPVYVVVFGSEKEYAPYRFNEFATAYYFGGADRDYIVIGRTGEQAAQIAVHEYVHLVARHAGLKFPPWLNEGIAELYSTIRMQGDKVLVGDLIPARLQALSQDKWVPLSVILSAGPDSPYYNEKNKAGSLYNEGWALVHMLQLSPDYVSKYSEFVSAVQSGLDSAAALEKVYGKTVSAVEKDLQDYIRSFQFYGRLFPVKLANAKEKFPATPAPMFDVKLALADLTNRPGKEAETRKTLEDLAREDPKRPEPWAGLGYLAWRRNQICRSGRSVRKGVRTRRSQPQASLGFRTPGRAGASRRRDQCARGSCQAGARTSGRAHGTRRFESERPASRRSAFGSFGCAHCAPRMMRLASSHCSQMRRSSWAIEPELVSRWRDWPRTRRRPRIGRESSRCSAISIRPTVPLPWPPGRQSRAMLQTRRPAWCVRRPLPNRRPCLRPRPRSKDPSLNLSVWRKASRWWSIPHKERRRS